VRMGITKETCVCVRDPEAAAPTVPVPDGALLTRSVDVGVAPQLPEIVLGRETHCQQRYTGTVLGISSQTVLDGCHFLSAGAVSFARGLNDTPKIAALLLSAGVLGAEPGWAFLLVAVGMALGGLLSARRVAETMSKKITPLNHGQGFTANLVTSALVIGASLLGSPVSTTHVSVGSLFGIGTVTREADPRAVYKIFASWLLTLPVAAVLGYGAFALLRTFG